VAIPRQAAGIKPKGGIAYDEREDIIYVASEAGITTNTKLVERLGPMDTDALGQLNPFSVPQDFSDTLVPIGGSTSYAISAWGQHIVVVP